MCVLRKLKGQQLIKSTFHTITRLMYNDMHCDGDNRNCVIISVNINKYIHCDVCIPRNLEG